jgi:hypothetical protein
VVLTTTDTLEESGDTVKVTQIVIISVASLSILTTAATGIILSSNFASTTTKTAIQNGLAIATILKNPGSIFQRNARGNLGGAKSPQLFWLMLNHYQMIEIFLLLEVDFHKTMIDLLESINFSTFNLDWLPIPFSGELQSVIRWAAGPNEPSAVELAMQRAGYNENLFLADYINFFLFLILFVFLHLMFYLVAKKPKDLNSYWGRFTTTVKRYFTYTTYLRLFLNAYFFIMVAAFVEFRSKNK